MGLRNARLNFRQQEPTHIMENIVYNELLIRGYNVDVGIVEAYAKMMKKKQLESSLKLILWSIRGVRDIIFRWLMI